MDGEQNYDIGNRYIFRGHIHIFQHVVIVIGRYEN